MSIEVKEKIEELIGQIQRHVVSTLQRDTFAGEDQTGRSLELRSILQAIINQLNSILDVIEEEQS